MANISARSSVVAIKRETTEGVLVAPTGGTEAIPVEDGFTMTTEFEVLDNTEVKSSIGLSQPILGIENPTADAALYLKHSGVEGQAPNWGLVLESLLGTVRTAGTEYDTAVGSTTSIIVGEAAASAAWVRGDALLIKDPTNGYRIRGIESVDGVSATLGFEVPTAPASGIPLGKSVTYLPANSGHPSYSLWNYLGNGGAIQALAGCKTVTANITIEAGQLVNMQYSIAGVNSSFDPIFVQSSDRYVDFTDDDGTFAAAVATGWYKTPHELADAVSNAMDDANSGEVHTLAYQDSDGKFKFTSTGTTLSILWASGANAANSIGSLIGFNTSVNASGTGAATGYTAASAMSWAFPYTATYDDVQPLAAKNQEVMVGDTDDYVCFEARTANVTIENTRAQQLSICEESGVAGSAITQRQVTVELTSYLQQYDADKFQKFIHGENVKFQYSFGEKDGGSWVPGKCGCIFIPTATITAHLTPVEDNLVQLQMTLQAYVNSQGAAEVSVPFL